MTTTDTFFQGTVFQWTTNDRTLTLNFTRTSVPTRMVHRYKHLSLYPYLIHCFEVPVIVVFTKYDQFLRNVTMHVLDYPDEYPDSDASEVAEKIFREYYLLPLGEAVRFVRLESKFRTKCQDSILISLGRNA
jgi:hypothetical protein